jgi:glycerophosphoryl diester phosphodiesterase
VERSRPVPKRRPELVAHRGYAKRYPENTLEALAAAIEAGARFVEVDVQLSKDRHPFLFHDRSLDRMCGVAGPLHARTQAELAKLPCSEAGTFGEAFASVRIADLPGLIELLRAHPGVRAFVEIKRASIEVLGAPAILDVVLPLLEPVEDRVALISFSLPFLAEAKRRTRLPLGAVFDAWSELGSPEASALGAAYVFCDVEGLPASGPLEARGARIAVYEVADPAHALELGSRGVDLVETFAIGEMLAAFRELDAGPDSRGGPGAR